MRIVIIILLTVISLSVLGQANKQCYEKVYKVTDTLPKLISKPEDVLRILKNEIVIPDSLKNRWGHLIIMYVINCNGDLVNLRTAKTADSDGNIEKNEFGFLSSEIFKIVKREIKWIPARHGGKTVDFLQIFSITFDKGEIRISLTAT